MLADKRSVMTALIGQRSEKYASVGVMGRACRGRRVSCGANGDAGKLLARMSGEDAQNSTDEDVSFRIRQSCVGC
jgi:hypothetical protein